MSQEQWTLVDDYISDHVSTSDPILEHALSSTQAAEIPSINVSPTQGKYLHLLAKISGAKKILEIGTLGGYSTIWLARALPADGSLITLEFSPEHADVAQSNINNAGLSHLVEIKVGAALDTLPKLVENGSGPFDFIFIDADKVNNANYLSWALKLSHVGTVIICDNVIRGGHLVDEANVSPDLIGTREFFDAVAAEKRLSATALQTVGVKGYDGFAIALVIAD